MGYKRGLHGVGAAQLLGRARGTQAAVITSRGTEHAHTQRGRERGNPRGVAHCILAVTQNSHFAER